MAPRFLLCLMIASAALPVSARVPAMMDANGGGAGCPVAATAEPELDEARPGDKRVVPPSRTNRPATPRRGAENEAAARPPRWHSFLPGMIR